MGNFKVSDIVWVDQQSIGEVMHVDDSGSLYIKYRVQVDRSFDDSPTVRECFEHQLSEFKPVITEGLPF